MRFLPDLELPAGSWELGENPYRMSPVSTVVRFALRGEKGEKGEKARRKTQNETRTKTGRTWGEVWGNRLTVEFKNRFF
jgi:hypothetical protein